MSLVFHLQGNCTHDLSRFKRTIVRGDDDVIIGNGVQLDDTDDDLGQLDVEEQIFTSYPFTMMGWGKCTDSTAVNTIMSFADASSADVFYSIGIYSDEGEIRARNTTLYADAGGTALDGAWNHVVGVFESAIIRKLYVNGALALTAVDSVAYNTNVDRFSIGRLGDSSPGAYFGGNVDDIRVYDTAQSADWIKDYVNRTRERIRGR